MTRFLAVLHQVEQSTHAVCAWVTFYVSIRDFARITLLTFAEESGEARHHHMEPARRRGALESGSSDLVSLATPSGI